jgi:hypothetical protein
MARRVSQQGTTPSGKKLLYPIHAGPQMEFMTSDAEEILYGGAAGGGKSHAIRALLVSYCLEHPGATVVLFRRTYRELEDTHILRLQMELPIYLASYKSSSHDFVFKNGSILMMRFCEKEEDVRSYDTFEADMMAFDELTAFTEFQYVYLITRCRSTKPWWKGPKIISATNPGNIGHTWVKRRWIDSAEPLVKHRAPLLEGGMTRQFIPAKVTDNTTLMKSDPNYVHRLSGLPDEERRAKLFGDWDVFSGQFFQRWRPNVHVVNPFEIPREWSRYISVDWGLAAPHAVYWAGRPPMTNSVWLYREQYGAGVPTRQQARMAAERVKVSGEKIEFVVADPAMWAREKDADGDYMKSPADYWIEEFKGICEVVKGNNERLAGASLYREMIDWSGVELPDGSLEIIVPPRLHVMRDACPNYVRTVPNLIHSKTNVEDVDTDGEDHSYDSTRYLFRALFEPPKKPKAKRYIEAPDGSIRILAA